MFLFNILIVSSWLFSNKQQTQRNSEHQVGVTLLIEIFIFVREIANCKGVSLSKTLKGWRRQELKSASQLPLFTVLFLSKLP